MDAMRFPVADEFTISSAKLRRRTLTSGRWDDLKSCWLQFEDCVFKGKIFACLSVRRIASESLRNVRTYLRMSSIVFLQLMNCSKCLHTRFCLAVASLACTRTILLSSSTSACTNQRLSECYAIIREHRKTFASRLIATNLDCGVGVLTAQEELWIYLCRNFVGGEIRTVHTFGLFVCRGNTR